MTMRCLLCGEPTGLRAIGAMVVVEGAPQVDGAVVCRRCTALPAEEQTRRRDAAMVRAQPRPS